MTDDKTEATEWARVAQEKWDHYQKLTARYKQGDAGLDLAIRHHEHGLAKMVPHLVVCIRGFDETHRPDRTSDVATWLKRHRDLHDRGSEIWQALDWLLDDYRDHADTGTALTEDVAGPHAGRD